MGFPSPDILETELRQLHGEFAANLGTPMTLDPDAVEAMARQLSLCAEFAGLMAEEISRWRQMGQLATAPAEGSA